MAGPTYNVAALIDNQVASDARKIVTVNISDTGAITAGTPVAVNPAVSTYGQGKTVKVNVVDDNPLMVGIVVASIASTDPRLVQVQVGGPIYATDAWNPTAQGAISAGNAVGGNNSTTTKTIKAVGTCAATIQPFAVCMTAYTSGAADGSLLIIDKGWF